MSLEPFASSRLLSLGIELELQIVNTHDYDLAPSAADLLRLITEKTTAVMESINDIVWTVNAENDDMEHVVQRMRAHAIRLAEADGRHLRFEIGEGLERIPLDMGQRRDLYLVFKEALNNALKYSGCTKLVVQLDRHGPEIVLTMSDNGVGFDPLHIPDSTTGGNGLTNMRRRATDLGGSLHVRSSPGSGTTVTLRFRHA